MPSGKSIRYPFVPRSTAHLLAGQFFSFRLSDGNFACGRILSTAWPDGSGRRSMFYFGLMDWCGDKVASSEDLAGRGLLYENWGHIVMFVDYSARIDGFRSLELDGIEPAPKDGAAGRAVLKNMAEKHLVRGKP
jgi:hypothetical protein